MKWLVWSIRTWFCNHEWDIEERPYEKHYLDENFVARNVVVSATCKKCGWHRKYKKF